MVLGIVQATRTDTFKGTGFPFHLPLLIRAGEALTLFAEGPQVR